MAKIEYLLFCEKAFATQGSNNLNLIGVFNESLAHALPVVISASFVVSISDAASSKIKVKFSFGGNELVSLHEGITTPEQDKVQIVNNFVLELKDFGVYLAKVYVNDGLLGETSFVLKKA